MVLLLTSAFGDGHNAAAANLARSFQARGIATHTLDLFEKAYPLLGQLSKNAYRTLITHTPWLWEYLYRKLGHYSQNPSHGGIDFSQLRSFTPYANALEQRLHKHQPDLLISTYPLYAMILATLKRRGVALPPLHTVITDSITIHPTWTQYPSDHYHVTDPQSAEILAHDLNRNGYRTDSIHHLGFPTHPDLQKSQTPPSPAQPPSENAPWRILYLPTTSKAQVRSELTYLTYRPQPLHLTIVMGRHASRLYHTIQKHFDRLEKSPSSGSGPGTHTRTSHRWDILGWCSDLPQRIPQQHLIIAKAGGATAHEVLAATRPLLINNIIPGQEEGNATLLQDIGGARLATTQANFTQAINQILTNPEKHWTPMQQSMEMHRPTLAADEITKLALNTI